MKKDVNNIKPNFVDSFILNRKERNLISRRTEHLIQTQTYAAIVIIRIYRHLHFECTHRIIAKKEKIFRKCMVSHDKSSEYNDIEETLHHTEKTLIEAMLTSELSLFFLFPFT
jgi:hypothetical protein